MTFLKSVIKSISPNRPDKTRQRGGDIVWVRTEILDAAASLEGGGGGGGDGHGHGWSHVHGRRRKRGGASSRAPEGDGGADGDSSSSGADTWGWARAKLTHKSRQLATERGVEVERYLRVTVLPPPHGKTSPGGAGVGYDVGHVGRRAETPATPDVDEFIVQANPHDRDDDPENDGVGLPFDLADLPHVHEPGVVSELARRFLLSSESVPHSDPGSAPSPTPESPPHITRGGRGRVPPSGVSAAIDAGGATYALAGPRVLLSIRPMAAPNVFHRFDHHDATLRRYIDFGAGVVARWGRRPGHVHAGGEEEGPLPPHVYFHALGAYMSMCDDFADGGGRGGGGADHALLVTGEGGSGRTTANVLAVRFLTALSAHLRSGGASTRLGDDPSVSSPGKDRGGAGGTAAGTSLKSEYLDGTSPRSAATLNLMRNYGDDDGDDEAPWGSTSQSVPEATCTMEQKVLHAGAILQSFGSAFVGIDRPNSSRYVSCLRLRFGPERGDGLGGDDHRLPPLLLSGASVEASLLETSRLVVGRAGRLKGRNFHVFHQVMAGVAGVGGEVEEEEELEERTRLAERCWLQDARADDFDITRGDGEGEGDVGGIMEPDGSSSADLEGYRRLRRAMTVVGFPRSEQEGIVSIVSALLHFSNVTAVDTPSPSSVGVAGGASDGTASELDYDNPSLPAALDLLGVTADDVNHVLCSRCVAAGNETHFRSVSTVEARRTVAGIVRAAYGALFELIVHSINASVAGGAGGGGIGGNADDASSSIVLMDAFGFEDHHGDGFGNSFEQLCANYCHEAWMQICNHLALVADQEEYRDEEIGWSSIDVPDNQDVLDLIDKKNGLGVLSILDEHCGAPGGATDALFVEDLHRRCWDHPRFGAGAGATHARSGGPESGRFTVRHHAAAVEYDVGGFVEKNHGVGGCTTSPRREATDLFVTSSNALVRRLGNIMMTSGATVAAAERSSSPGGGPTTGAKFSTQLRRIRMTIGRCSSGPHLVRCIRPNRSSSGGPRGGSFDYAVVANQVRCGGVVEGIELSRTGLPRRLTHSDFAARYRDLVAGGGGTDDFEEGEGEGEGSSSSLLTICDHLVSRPPLSDMSRDGALRVGRRSGVFLTEEAHGRLESLLANGRDRRENFGGFHALCRGHLARQEFFITLYCAVMLQSNVRRLIGANRARSLREARAREDNGAMSSDEVLSLLDRGRLSTNRLISFITEEISSLTRLIHSNLSKTKNGVDANEQLSLDENLVHLSPNDDRRKGELLGQVVMELASLRGFVSPGTDGTSQFVGQGCSIEPRGKKFSGGKTGASSRPYCGSTVDPDDAAASAVHELHALRREIERLAHDAGRARRDERRTLRDLAALRAAMKEMLALKEEGEAMRKALRTEGA